MISKQTSLEELAYFVCSALQKHGVEAVLTGGAAVSIYTNNRYQSFDLDFVTLASVKQITEAFNVKN